LGRKINKKENKKISEGRVEEWEDGGEEIHDPSLVS